MTQQETVERDVRLAIGDLHLQLIIARATIADLQQQLIELAAQKLSPKPEAEVIQQPEAKSKANGKDHPAVAPAT